MTWASPKGGESPVDRGSIAAYENDTISQDFLNSRTYKDTFKLSDVNVSNFDGIFVVGGYGVMWDLVGNKDLEELVRRMWESNGIVSGVCHGPAAFVGVKLGSGRPLVEGKEVACFTDDEEKALNRSTVVPETCETALKGAGAKYTHLAAWSVHVAQEGKLITGQNPMSAKSTAEAVCRAFGVLSSNVAGHVTTYRGKMEINEVAAEPHASHDAFVGGVVGAILLGVSAVVMMRVARNPRIKLEEGAGLIDEEDATE